MSSPKNFKYLDELIHSGVKKIVLDSDIVLADREWSEYEDGVKLDIDDLVIDGNGHSIDANGKARIFFCTGKNITIKNITLKNGYAKKGGGGAIYNSENNLSISGSTLSGNNTKRRGGAIHNGGELTITDSSLIGNTAKGGGGAICLHRNKLNIRGSTLSDNTAKGDGGAIHNGGELTITDSSLTGNTARTGGAIYNWEAELTITDSLLTGNTGKGGGGGAICHLGNNLSIRGSTLSDNTAKGDGGAIYSGDKLSIRGSTLSDNTAKGDGGAICHCGDKLSISGSILSGNTTKKRGGAIYNHGTYNILWSKEYKATVICNDCDFSNNFSNNFGGAIWSNYYVKFYRCTFYDNISEKDGNIIYFDAEMDDISLIIENSLIKNNYSTKTDIYIKDFSYALIKYTKISNTADNYVIYNEKGILSVINLEFEYSNKQSIYNNNTIWISNKSIEKSIESSRNSVIKYKNQKSDSNNGFQYLESQINNNSKYITLDCDIIMDEFEQDYYEGGIELKQDNLILDGQNHTIDANNLSRIFIITGNNITLMNIKFKNGSYFKNEFDEIGQGGGAIYSLPDTSVNIENCEFSDNNSRNTAGCINNKGVMNIYKTTFNNNFAQKSCGAIYNSKVLNLDCCDFKNNFAPPFNNYEQLGYCYGKTGGNIFNKGDVTFNKCNFIKTKYFYLIKISHTFTYADNILVSLFFICIFIFIVIILEYLFRFGPILMVLLLVVLSFSPIIISVLIEHSISIYLKKHGFYYFKIG